MRKFMGKFRINNYSIILSLLILVFIYFIFFYSKKEGFVGKTFVLDETGLVCPSEKTKLGNTGKPMSDTKFLDGISCPSGYSPGYASYQDTVSAHCLKNIQMCDDGYKYDKHSKDPKKMCINTFNSFDRKPTKNNVTCPLPDDDEIRIIDTAFCQIVKKDTPKCSGGLLFDYTINKCYKCS
jgi:hypothetical protein